MNQEGCFITYFDLANEVKEMARGYDFTVSSVEKFKKSGRLCYVWIVDEGDPTSPMTRNVLSRSREITGNGKNKRERKGENPFPWK